METPPVSDKMVLTAKEHSALTAQASNYRSVLRFLQASGINNFLAEKRRVPVDIELHPDDMTASESIILFLKSIADECKKMDEKIINLSRALVDSEIALARIKIANENKPGFFEKIKNFIFEKDK